MEIIIFFIVLVAVLLVIVILAQNSKGGGLTSQFGGSGAGNIIGVKKTSDLLEKLSWGLALVLCLLCVSTTVIQTAGKTTTVTPTETTQEIQEDGATQAPATNGSIEGLEVDTATDSTK